MGKLTALIAILLVMLALPAMFAADTAGRVYANGGLPDIYVNIATGSESYDGSSPVHTTGNVGPVKSITKGRTLVSSSGTIHVAAGTYNENVHLSFNMNLVGNSALDTVIDGMANGQPALEVSSAPLQTNTISGFTIQNGRGAGSASGGGVYISSDHIVTINDCAIINNMKSSCCGNQPGAGGGVCNDNGEVHMNRCTISGNSASGRGGGIANICTAPGGGFGKMYLTNCTIAGNTVTEAGGVGGGLYNDSDADVTLLNVTIASNQCTNATSFGGGYSNSSASSMYFRNCIVANNTAGVAIHNNAYNGLGSGINSQGYNIDSLSALYFTDPTDQVANPLLGPLQNNGGPTSTMAITSSSPAYNRGKSDGAPATDQRGIARPQLGAFDIGAYEYTGPTDTRSASVNTSLGTVNFSLNNGSISGLTTVDPVIAGCAPPGFIFPYGYFNFTISNLALGGSVRITIRLPSPLPQGAIKYYKCYNGTLVDMTSYISQPDTTTIILTLTDGGPGDSDGRVNGSITDPGGPCVQMGMLMPRTLSSSLPAVTSPVSMSNISVKSASLSTTAVAPGAPVTVTATIANTGMANGSARIKLFVNGREESSQGVSLASGGMAPVKFTVSRSEPGTYSVYVGGVNAGSFTVDAFADPNIILYLSGAAMFFALVAGVIFMSARRRR